MKLSAKAVNLTPSEPRKIYEEARKYTDVIDLTLGDPDLIPPENIRRAACRAVMEGRTRYSANAGLRELREKITEEAENEYGVSYDPDSEVIVTVGAMEAAYLSLWSLLDPGDEAIIVAPFWINYKEVVKSLGAIPVFVETREEDGFVVVPEEIEKKITNKTKLLVINSPANPTGAVIPGSVLARIAEIAIKHDIIVISDEIYSHLVYDGKKCKSILSCSDMKERTVVINGFSKRFAMTGYRVGWALAPREVVSAMTQMTENIVACAPLPSQYAAIEALSWKGTEDYIREEFEKRRNCVLSELAGIEEISCAGIPGTFYAFLNVAKSGMSGKEFALSLLKEKQVALIYGSAYGGEAYKDYVRIAFTMECKKLREAFRRIREFLAEKREKKL